LDLKRQLFSTKVLKIGAHHSTKVLKIGAHHSKHSSFMNNEIGKLRSVTGED
jgi:hypothetical protein